MEAPLIVTLRNGPLKLDLAPSIGGTIVGFSRDGLALMRETPEEALREGLARQTCSYPLIPYSNRIAHGRFAYEGVEYQLALNFADHPHSIHGNAWQNAWDVAEVSDTRCHLALQHRPVGDAAQGWPFAYRAEQIFELAPDGLTLTLILENQDKRTMPAGLGLHPFFPKRRGVSLQFAAKSVYRKGDDLLPIASTPVPSEWDYSDMRELGEPRLDNCFKGWSGTAEIRFEPEKVALRIQADPLLSHLVVYVPPGRDFFAVEPVSHVNNAINRPDFTDHGLKDLQPGERLTARVRFSVEVLS